MGIRGVKGGELIDWRNSKEYEDITFPEIGGKVICRMKTAKPKEGTPAKEQG